MKFVESRNGVNYFAYEHSLNYQQVQMKFLEAVESLNPDNIVVRFYIHNWLTDYIYSLKLKITEKVSVISEYHKHVPIPCGWITAAFGILSAK